MSNNTYKKLIEGLMRDSLSKRLASWVLYGITPHYTGGIVKEFRDLLGSDNPSLGINRLDKSLEHIINDALNKKRYITSIFPSTISIDKARNFYIGSNDSPSEYEIYRYLYLLLDSIVILAGGQRFYVNIDNVNRDLWKRIKEFMISDKILVIDNFPKKSMVDFKSLRRDYQIPTTPFTTAILILSYIARKFHALSRTAKSMYGKYLRNIGITDETMLFLVVWKGEKKETYFIPRLYSIFIKWFPDERSVDKFLAFISSLFTVGENNKYRDKSSHLLDKFLFYLLHGYVNGELLVKLIELRIVNELSKKEGRIYGFRSADYFFDRL